MTDWLATILIFLPLAGAILVCAIPIGRIAGSVALLFALAGGLAVLVIVFISVR